jgi:hypothetical protein
MISTSKLWPFRPRTRTLPAAVRPTTAAAARILGTPQSQAPEEPELPRAQSDMPPVSARTETDVDASDDQVAETTRKFERYVPVRPHTTLLDDRGKRHGARIMNLSATGVAVEANFGQLDVRSITHVGATPVKAGRRIQRGMVFIFDKPLDPTRCSENTTL